MTRTKEIATSFDQFLMNGLTIAEEPNPGVPVDSD